MIRFIIKRHMDNGRTVGTSTFETFDVDVPELESALTGGGHDHAGSYDVRELVGAEVMPKPSTAPPAVDIEAIVERAWNMAEGETAEGKEPAESEWTRFGTHCVTLALAAT